MSPHNGTRTIAALRVLGLVSSSGHGAGARWRLG